MDIFFNATWEIFKESSFYILVGFFFAGLVHYLIPAKDISRHLGGNGIKSVVKAAILGIPLPLCSCSVIPTAFKLKKSGASKGSVVSFLISTPETGVDSIFITYSLMGPVIMIARPLAAFFTATCAGIAEVILGKNDPSTEAIHEHTEECSDCCSEEPALEKSIKRSMAYAFGDLFNDIYLLFFLGVVIAGAISAFIPYDMVYKYLDSELLSMLSMLVISVPMYMCATASTPIAAALMMNGLSPGAAVVFLLAGPATNFTTLTILTKNLGKRTTFIYLISIIVCSLIVGYTINFFYDVILVDADMLKLKGGELVPEIVKIISSFAILIFSVITFIRQNIINVKR